MARRKFSIEFKKSAVQLVKQQGYSLADAARSLGVDPGSIRGWIEQFGHDIEAATPGSDAALRTENAKLRQENARLKMEREILKKAASFFAKEQP